MAQDVFLWLVRNNRLLSAPPVPWLSVVVRNFIRRYWRGRKVRTARESRAVAEAAVFARGDDGAESVDVRLSLDRIERRLPAVEAKLLHLVRRGCSFSEAVAALHIPRGSRSFFRKRLIAHLADGLRAPGTGGLPPPRSAASRNRAV